MIYLEQRKLVLITPPHTASGNLHRALCSAAWGGYWVLDRAGESRLPNHHAVVVPAAWRHVGARVFLVTRNPLDRLRGLWRHHVWWQREHGHRHLEWHQYVAAAAADDRQTLPNWIDRWTITRLQANHRIDGTIRFEQLAQELAQVLGDAVDLPPRNTPPYENDDWYTDPATRRHAHCWAQPDFDTYGYSP